MHTAVLFAALLLCVVAHERTSYLDRINHNYRAIQIDTSITLSVTPTLLEKSGEVVTVKWSGVPSPNEDYIAAFSPGNVSTVPIRFATASLSKVCTIKPIN
jgi:hypothetical protein